jgi:uncharacterized protein (UPF0548 family)
MRHGLVAELRAASFTYPDVGATAGQRLPAGYGHLERTRELPQGTFDTAVERLMTWQLHEAAGLSVTASSQRVEPGVVVEMFLGPSWLRVRAVCRIVYVIDEADRVGFAYGTLPGHAEAGEESFVLDRGDGQPRFTIRAFSNSASRLSRVGGPLTRRVQIAMADRYLRAATT